MSDFNYGKLPSIIEIANSCQELKDVVANQMSGKLPPTHKAYNLAENLGLIATMIMFDTRVQSRWSDVTLISWI